MRPRPSARLEEVGISLIRQVFDAAPPEAINLGLGEPTFDTPGAILAAAHAALERGRLGYTANAGLPELRRAIAARADAGPDEDSVCVTAGASEALLASMLARLGPGDEVLVPDPGYPAYPAIARLAGAKPVAYRLRAEEGFRFTATSLAQAVTAKTRAVVLNSPANPTGTVIPADQLEQVAQLAACHDLLVISDEVYREIYFGERPASYLQVSADGLIIGSLSKMASMTGWRLGWVIGPPAIIRPITVVHQYAVTCAPTLSQMAALAALGDEATLQLEAMRNRFLAHRDLMVERVQNRLGFPYLLPQGAFYLLVEAAPVGNSLAVALELLERARVITVPGAAFGQQADRFLRLSFSASKDDIREGIDRLAACLR
ncbi:MAG: pyridoxal phosphate-dependent aminotransferase [Acidobacteriota bacterium]